jgi:hypothetical protein
MPHETDSLGGAGLGPFWFADSDAPITDHPVYQLFSQQKVAGIDVSQVKGYLSVAFASAESAPIISYLRWLIDTCAAVA